MQDNETLFSDILEVKNEENACIRKLTAHACVKKL